MTPTYPWLSTYAGPLLATAVVLLAVLIGLMIWLALRLRRVETSYRTLTAGTNAGNLESILEDHVQQVRTATDRVCQIDEVVDHLARASRGHLQRISVLRFNPFRDSGGDQSFAVALADQDGNGVVISSLHGRDATRIYAKPLAGWESAYQLTDEERQVIQKARGES